MKITAPIFLLGLSVMMSKVESRGSESILSESAPKCPGGLGSHYYADVSTGCKVFVLCHGSRSEHFVCSPGLIFDEKKGVCDFPSKVDCISSSGGRRFGESTLKAFRRRNKTPLKNIAVQNIQVHVNAQPKVDTSSLVTGGLPKIKKATGDSGLASFSFTAAPTTDSSLSQWSEKSSGDGVSIYINSHSSAVSRKDYQDVKKQTSTVLESDTLLSDVVQPIILVVASNRTALHDLKRAVLSVLLELKPIFDELIHSKASRTKRSAEESAVITATPEADDDFPGSIPPELHGTESEMYILESMVTHQYEQMRKYFKDFRDLIRSDEEYAGAAVGVLEKVILRDILRDIWHQFEAASNERQKRFAALNSPVVIPRSLVEQFERSIKGTTGPLVKSVLTATLPAILKTASENVPLLISVVDNLKPLIKDRFPHLLSHVAALVNKYQHYKHNMSPSHVVLPPPIEMLQDFMPLLTAGIDIGAEHLRRNPTAGYEMLFGRTGALSQLFQTRYTPASSVARHQSAAVRTRYQPNPYSRRAGYQRINNNARQIAARLAAVRRG